MMLNVLHYSPYRLKYIKDLQADTFKKKLLLTCWRAIVAHRCAGAAPVLVGGLGGEAQRAAPSSHVVHVIISLLHDAGGEAGVDGRLVPHRAGHHAGRLLHLICPLTERHHLDNKIISTVNKQLHLRI